MDMGYQVMAKQFETRSCSLLQRLQGTAVPAHGALQLGQFCGRGVQQHRAGRCEAGAGRIPSTLRPKREAQWGTGMWLHLQGTGAAFVAVAMLLSDNCNRVSVTQLLLHGLGLAEF